MDYRVKRELAKVLLKGERGNIAFIDIVEDYSGADVELSGWDGDFWLPNDNNEVSDKVKVYGTMANSTVGSIYIDEDKLASLGYDSMENDVHSVLKSDVKEAVAYAEEVLKDAGISRDFFDNDDRYNKRMYSISGEQLIALGGDPESKEYAPIVASVTYQDIQDSLDHLELPDEDIDAVIDDIREHACEADLHFVLLDKLKQYGVDFDDE